jgi:hypothetical protein
MVAAPSTPAEPEALRRAALEALRGARPDAPELRRRYAESCVRRSLRRSRPCGPAHAGRALRIVVLVAAQASRRSTQPLRRWLALPRESFQVAFAALATRSRRLSGWPRVATCALDPSREPVRTAEEAKRLAALDADVLIDLAA